MALFFWGPVEGFKGSLRTVSAGRSDVTAVLLTDLAFELLKVEKVGFSLTSGFGFPPPPEVLGVLLRC